MPLIGRTSVISNGESHGCSHSACEDQDFADSIALGNADSASKFLDLYGGRGGAGYHSSPALQVAAYDLAREAANSGNPIAAYSAYAFANMLSQWTQVLSTADIARYSEDSTKYLAIAERLGNPYALEN